MYNTIYLALQTIGYHIGRVTDHGHTESLDMIQVIKNYKNEDFVIVWMQVNIHVNVKSKK